MTLTEFILLISALVLLAACVALAIALYNNKKAENGLKESIEKYLQKGELTPFSTKDNDFSYLQNAVCDLQNAVELEKSNSDLQSKKNSEFIADVSHQLKTPIAGLRLYVEMDNSLNPTDHTKKELQLIEKTENLIGKLLMLQKLKTDEYKMDFENHNIKDIVSSIIKDLEPLYPEKTITVKGYGQIRCDKSWIFEALENIVKNSCQHTGNNGKVDILIDEGERSVIVTVTDNGGGVSEKDLKTLFRRFTKTDNASPESTGLGLAITRAIIEKHHGTVSAENCEGGLKITVCMPKISGKITI